MITDDSNAARCQADPTHKHDVQLPPSQTPHTSPCHQRIFKRQNDARTLRACPKPPSLHVPVSRMHHKQHSPAALSPGVPVPSPVQTT